MQFYRLKWRRKWVGSYFPWMHQYIRLTVRKIENFYLYHYKYIQGLHIWGERLIAVTGRLLSQILRVTTSGKSYPDDPEPAARKEAHISAEVIAPFAQHALSDRLKRTDDRLPRPVCGLTLGVRVFKVLFGPWSTNWIAKVNRDIFCNNFYNKWFVGSV